LPAERPDAGVSFCTRICDGVADPFPVNRIMLVIEDLKTALFGPLDISLAPGECVAVMGPSGAGKSVFLRAIADLDPSSGEVTLDGAARSATAAPDWRRKVALVPAESGWWADKVGDHFPPGEPGPALLEALGLPPEVMDWSVDRLSSGERHRAALARALCRHPAAILLDEPTASLDEASTKRVEALVRQQLAGGVPMIIVTHDAAQAERLAARTLWLCDGRFTDKPAAAQ
jgi:ABC-type iron transport system FetAB ATPase subunit